MNPTVKKDSVQPVFLSPKGQDRNDSALAAGYRMCSCHRFPQTACNTADR